MNKTIREAQIEWLKDSLKTALFNATLHRASTQRRAMVIYPADGSWYLTQDDLDEIFVANGRDIQAKIVDTRLELWLPQK